MRRSGKAARSDASEDAQRLDSGDAARSMKMTATKCQHMEPSPYDANGIPCLGPATTRLDIAGGGSLRVCDEHRDEYQQRFGHRIAAANSLADAPPEPPEYRRYSRIPSHRPCPECFGYCEDHWGVRCCDQTHDLTSDEDTLDLASAADETAR